MFFAVAGLYYFAVMLSWHWARWPGDPSWKAWLIFLVLGSVSVSLVCCLAYLGVRLLKNDETAARYSIVVFTAEIAYFLVSVVLFWVIAPMRSPELRVLTVGFLGIAAAPIDPQIMTGYAFFGLVLMLWRRSKSTKGQLR